MDELGLEPAFFSSTAFLKGDVDSRAGEPSGENVALEVAVED